MAFIPTLSDTLQEILCEEFLIYMLEMCCALSRINIHPCISSPPLALRLTDTHGAVLSIQTLHLAFCV